MRYVLRVIELAVLIVLIAVTVQNSHAVEFKWFFGQSWSAPFIVFLLLFFIVGVLVGLLATLTYYLKMRRELAQMKKDLHDASLSKVKDDPSDALGE